MTEEWDSLSVVSGSEGQCDSAKVIASKFPYTRVESRVPWLCALFVTLVQVHPTSAEVCGTVVPECMGATTPTLYSLFNKGIVRLKQVLAGINCRLMGDKHFEKERKNTGTGIFVVNWLNSASASLSELAGVKTPIYNITLTDARHLKPSSLHGLTGRSHSFSDLSTDSHVTTVSLKKNAWASNSSIPDLLKKSEKTRPGSAHGSSHSVRPPSGKRNRPHSAKEKILAASSHINKGISVHGAKYDPTCRPPTGLSQHVTTGWIATPNGDPLVNHLDESSDIFSMSAQLLSPPPAPKGSPIPDSSRSLSPVDLLLDGHMEAAPARNPSPALPPSPEHICFTLPTVDDYNEEDTLDTSRLLQNIRDKKEASEKVINKHGVTFSEDQNLTVNITPRNMGRKVKDKQNKHTRNTDKFRDALYGEQMGKNCFESGKTETNTSKNSNYKEWKSKPETDKKSDKFQNNNSIIKNDKENPNDYMENIAKSITVVTVSYGDEQCELDISANTISKKTKSTRTRRDVTTMIQDVTLSDSEEDEALTCDHTVPSSNQIVSDDSLHVSPEPRKSTTPIIARSEPVKNYYEISRQNTTTEEEKVDVLFKSTKTIEFDENCPTEMVIKSVIDPVVSNKKSCNSAVKDCKHPARPVGMKLLRRPQPPSQQNNIATNNYTCGEEERCVSRQGFVPMAPDVTVKNNNTNQIAHFKNKSFQMKKRPLSAPSSHPQLETKVKTPESIIEDKVETTPDSSSIERNVESKEETGSEQNNDCNTDLKENADVHLIKEKSVADHSERNKSSDKSIIQDLIKEALSISNVKVGQDLKKKLSRPVSASHVTSGVHKVSVGRRAASAHCPPTAAHARCKANLNGTQKRLCNFDKHYASYSRSAQPRRKTKTKKVTYTEPVHLFSKMKEETETKEQIESRALHDNLVGRGINIAPETLERALFPPTGRSKYYEITAELPKSSSLGLLSHPKIWLPEEYRTLRIAERNLARANEIMYKQEVAERKARLAELTAGKKKKKKGKKGKTKLKRSNSAV